MFADPGPAPQEIHQYLENTRFEQKIPLQKESQFNPRLVLGGPNLFEYKSESHSLVLSTPFRKLLKLLIDLGELDKEALAKESLSDLNAVLQKPQGSGGLLRKEGLERWELKDSVVLEKSHPIIDKLLRKLGFAFPQSISHEMTVDHCIVFGALVERMETRIRETLAYLQTSLKVTGHVFLLGSDRKLIEEERKLLRSKLEKSEEPQKTAWTEIFDDPNASTEANAFLFLWQTLVPSEMQAKFEDKLICIKSTRNGSSYRETDGHRATTQTTVEDWMPYYTDGEPQTIFAIAEQPYMRLTEQLRWTVLSKGGAANIEELFERIKNTTFYFAHPMPSSKPLICVVLDEIARNVYQVFNTVKYLERLESKE